jgi:hypothetical protein
MTNLKYNPQTREFVYIPSTDPKGSSSGTQVFKSFNLIDWQEFNPDTGKNDQYFYDMGQGLYYLYGSDNLVVLKDDPDFVRKSYFISRPEFEYSIEEIEAQIQQLQQGSQALDEHKISDDHDGRYYPRADVDTLLDAKVDKVNGKQLSSEDYSTSEKSKLAAIQSGATANSPDADLRDRSTHTGTQSISTVAGLQTALDGKEAAFSKNSAFNKNFGSSANTVTEGNDARLSNSREWTASTISQAEAEAGEGATRRAWTSQRVRQAILGWWNNSAFKTKLDGIATGATANDTNAQLRDRATHTGTQAISTVSGLQTALDGKAPTVHTHAISDVTGLQDELLSIDERLGDLEFEEDVQPSLSLDFEKNEHFIVEEFGLVPKQLTDLIITTNGAGTRVDHRGLIVPTVVDRPVIDYSSLTGASLGLRMNIGITNLVTYSADATQPVWAKLASTQVENSSFNSPIETKNFQLIKAASSGVQTVGITHSLSTYTDVSCVSFYAKPHLNVRFVMVVLQGVEARVTINLDTGAFNPNAAATGVTVIREGDRWFALFPSIAGITGVRIFIKKDSAVGSTSSDFVAGEGMYLLGFMHSRTNFLPPYVPTEANPVTRVADNPTRLLGSEFSRKAGSVYWEGILRQRNAGSSNSSIVGLFCNASNYIKIRYRPTDFRHNCIILKEGVASIIQGFGLLNPGLNKCMLVFDESTGYLCINGQVLEFSGVLEGHLSSLNWNLLLNDETTGSDRDVNKNCLRLRYYSKALPASLSILMTKV